MLVTFNSSTSGQILMFAEAARRLFEIIGKEGTARGVFTTEQLPEAIEKLKCAVAGEKSGGNQGVNPSGDDEAEESARNVPVGLAQRAYPLIELMERTYKDEGYVMWEAAGKF